MNRERERVAPRISVSKLGEYLVASPIRRRRIIHDQREPKDFIVAHYVQAQHAISRYLLDDRRDEERLRTEVERLRHEAGATSFETETNGLCADAIEAFLEIADDLNLDGLEVTLGEENPDQLSVAGVNVSVRPEILLRGRSRAGDGTVGALKLYLVKTNPLSEEAGEYVSTIVERWVAENMKGRGTRDRELCLVVDVFEGSIFAAPRAFRRRMSNVEAACEEIARAWRE